MGSVFDVSNADRLGSSEVEQVQLVVDGVKLMVEMEKKQSSNQRAPSSGFWPTRNLRHNLLSFSQSCAHQQELWRTGEAFTHLELMLFLHSKQLIKAMVALALCAMAMEGGGGGGTFVIGRCVTSKGFALLAHTRHVLSHL